MSSQAAAAQAWLSQAISGFAIRAHAALLCDWLTLILLGRLPAEALIACPMMSLAPMVVYHTLLPAQGNLELKDRTPTC